ncbi:hypothetical protein Ga0100231_016845 [Opitutaceae bacterium TAV4]|nr:hypothetical protein Ga0100231_016845 [Opitutaceae bacterium TAV4]
MKYPSLIKSITCLLLSVTVIPFTFSGNVDWISATGGDWNVAANWTDSTLPGTSDVARINTDGIIVNLGSTQKINALYIGNSGTGAATLNVNAGANLTLTGTLGLAHSSNNRFTATINQFENSSVSVQIFAVGATTNAKTGIYNLHGGTFTAGGVAGLGYGGGNGEFNQTGGTATFNAELRLLNGVRNVAGQVNEGKYTISGGILNADSNLVNGIDNVTDATVKGTGHAVLAIIGSNATINVKGNYVTAEQKDTESTVDIPKGKRSSTLDVSIDNGGLSKINLTTGTANVDGILKAGIKGGVAFTKTNEFAMIEADTGKISGNFATLPSSALWSAPSVESVSDTRDALMLSYAAAASKGDLAVSDTLSGLTFADAAAGFVTMSGLTSGNEVSIYINAAAGTGKTLGELITHFTDNGIVATATSESGYNILLSMTASGSTGYFAWDLSDFNATSTISALAALTTSNIPEPSIFALALAFVTAALALHRRGRRTHK